MEELFWRETLAGWDFETLKHVHVMESRVIEGVKSLLRMMDLDASNGLGQVKDKDSNQAFLEDGFPALISMSPLKRREKKNENDAQAQTLMNQCRARR